MTSAQRPIPKRKRLEAAISGDALDRPPVALWRPWPGDDQRPDTLAAAVVGWQKQFDFDFVKVTPASSYCLVDWGVQDRWTGNTEGTRDYTVRAVERAEDWSALSVLSPRRGELARQLEVLRLVTRGVGSATPAIATIFSPLAQAKNIAGGQALVSHLRRAPDALAAGLETITESILRFVEAARETGIAGIFYAIQHATFKLLSAAEYERFGRPYDLRILQAVADMPELWLNVIHLHGDEVMFDLVSDYPAQVLNWHDRETPPSLAQGLRRWNGAVCGGIRQWDTLVRGTPDAVQREARSAIKAAGGRRLIVSTGCVAPVITPLSNLRAARESVEA